MTTGDHFPTNPEMPLPQTAEALPLSDETQRSAKLAADITEVLHHPAFSAVTEMELEGTSLSPIGFYTQQMALGYKVSQTAQGNRMPLINSDIMKMLDSRRLSMYIKSTHNFHVMIDGLARYFTTSRDEFAINFADMPSGELVQPLFQDYLTFCEQGFVDEDGVKEEFHQAAMRLRMLNVALLFSPQATDPEYVDKVFETMYRLSAERRPAVDEEDVRGYAQELGRDVSSGKRLQKLSARYGSRAMPLLHRATEQLLIGNAKALFLGMSPEQIHRARQAYRNALGTMVGSDLERLHNTATAIEIELEALGTVKSFENVEQIIEASHLNWEVLPPGELEMHAREIVQAAQDTKSTSSPAVIDLSRLRTLVNLRTLLGEDRCYFARGKLGTRRKVKADGVEQADQYLLLVYRDLDDQGSLRGESVVAESPIANKHALYIFRYEVSGDGWQSAMALPKNMARDLGARPIKHVLSSSETDLVQTMTRKAMALLRCTPEEFPVLEFAGTRGVRLPRAALPKQPEV